MPDGDPHRRTGADTAAVVDTAALVEIIRLERAGVVATLRRLTGDLERAEDAFHDAVEVALSAWTERVPDRPGAWLTTVARRKALDHLRREGHRGPKEQEAMAVLDDDAPREFHDIRDDQLRLIFTCCHPALSPDARVALALRVICGLTTAEIARAFLTPEPTIGQRISRAKAKLAGAHIPYRVPDVDELPSRLAAVLAVVNVVFTTGHHAPAGAELVRLDLAVEALRLAELLADLMPGEPEIHGAIALFESSMARRTTRIDGDGSIVTLRDADRTRWDRALATRANERLEAAMRLGRPGPFQLQAAISCLHSSAPSHDETDWLQIVELYGWLEHVRPSPIVTVNKAIAVAQAHGPEAALDVIDGVSGLDDWHFLHLARADALETAGRLDDAISAVDTALDCSQSEIERRHTEQRRARLVALHG